MISQEQVAGLHGAIAYDRDGDRIGKIGAIYYDDRTEDPTWITVRTGLCGANETFVPVQGAQIDGDRVTLAYGTDLWLRLGAGPSRARLSCRTID